MRRAFVFSILPAIFFVPFQGTGAQPSGDGTEVSAHHSSKQSTGKVFELPKSITLDQCVELALKQNPQVLLAIQQIQQTQGQIISVRAQALPQINLGSAYNQTDPTFRETSFQQKQNWNVTLTASQLIYSGGQVNAAVKISKLENSNSYNNLRNTIDAVISTVRQEFYDVLLGKALVQVQEESVRLLESQLKDQKTRYEAGTVPRFNVLQAEVALSNQIPVLIKTKNQYLLSQLAISKTLGIPYETWHPGKTAVNPEGELQFFERKVDTAGLVQFAKEHRPSLKVLRQNILVQLEGIKVALAGYQPRLSADGGYLVRNTSLNEQLDQVVNGWFIGVNGSWAIFDGLATAGNVKQARAQLQSAKVSYDDGVLQLELEVQQAVFNMEQARETLFSQIKNVEQAEEALRLSQERLHAGAGTQLDVLNAQVQLTQARTNKLQALHDYNVALAELDRVTGAETIYSDHYPDPVHNHSRTSKKTVPVISSGDKS